MLEGATKLRDKVKEKAKDLKGRAKEKLKPLMTSYEKALDAVNKNPTVVKYKTLWNLYQSKRKLEKSLGSLPSFGLGKGN
jgi:hypothetical protein